MDSLTFNYHLEENRSVFTPANDLTTETITERTSPMAPPPAPPVIDAYAPLPPNFHGHSANELLTLLGQQEPRAGDTAPSTADLDEMMMNFRINGSEINFDEDPSPNFYMGHSGRESVASRGSYWNEGSASAPTTPRPNEQMVSFDFLVKSVSAANNYVSMLTREQLSILQSLRPSLLYEFLQEVAKVRSDRRCRRALPNECAFCKNNGENEECYSKHALKDWRGRVQCPVLRAFRCPRCGATGDRAHTIKYCPENNENERLSSRRRMTPSSLLLDQQGMSSPLGSMPPTPGSAPPPSPATGPMSHNNVWSFGMN